VKVQVYGITLVLVKKVRLIGSDPYPACRSSGWNAETTLRWEL
jgi:hypothetical protein